MNRAYKEDSIQLDEIGEVIIRKSRKAKNISIRLKPDFKIRLTIPYRASVKDGLDFVYRKRNWIRNKHEQLIETKPEVQISSGYKTLTFTVKTKSMNAPGFFIKREKDILHIFFPSRLNEESSEAQNIFRDIVKKELKKEAKIVLPELTAKLAQDNGFRYNQLRTKDIRSRWGSCSVKNNINLSIHLLNLPRYLIEFVILHELCHTKIKNHSKAFYTLLDSVSNHRAKELTRELKAYNHVIW